LEKRVKINLKSIQIWRIVDDKVVEQESVADELDLLKQMGLIVPTEKGKKLFLKDWLASSYAIVVVFINICAVLVSL
jgi:hypothetical protein